MERKKAAILLKRFASLVLSLVLVCALSLPALAADEQNNDQQTENSTLQNTTTKDTTTSDSILTEDEKPNTDISVIPSDANALVLMDTGAQSPKGVPGDVITIVLPVAVNKEYLPSERYMLRNINITPAIPNDTSVKNWPFDIINASYTRHLDDMSYNSTAEIYYDFRISEFATKGVYPVNFNINATVWRYDDVNGTNITEDVTFTLCVYVTIVGDGNMSGATTGFGALQIATFDEIGQVSTPTAAPGQTVTFKVPVVNRGGKLSDVTISPVVSSSVEEFPFVVQSSNYGRYFESWESGTTYYVQFQFTVSEYATNGNKPVTFRATYYENGAATECTFTSHIYIVNGYEKLTTKPSAMSVMVDSYKLLVDNKEVTGLVAGDEVTLKVTLKNNAGYGIAYRNVATISLANTSALALSVGSSDTDYVSFIKDGETAEVCFKLTVKKDASVGDAAISIQLAYENSSQVTGTATQVIMVPVSQPMNIVFDDPVVYGTPTTEKPISVSLSMINMGRAKAMNISILGSDGITVDGRYYGGDLAPAGTLDADFEINCSQVGTFTGKLIIQYEDANGNQYSQEVSVPLTIADPASTPTNTPDPTPSTNNNKEESGIPTWVLIVAVAVIVIVVVGVIIVVYQRKKQQKNEHGYDVGEEK